MSRTSRWLVAAMALVGLAASAPAAAEDVAEASPETLLETLRYNRKALVEVNLGLDDAEARAFWPIYDRYLADLGAIQERLLRVIEAYSESFGSLEDPQATKLVEDYLEIEQDRAELRRSYLAPIAEVLPGRKVLRVYQIENKIEAVLRYELARTIPVVEQ